MYIGTFVSAKGTFGLVWFYVNEYHSHANHKHLAISRQITK